MLVSIVTPTKLGREGLVDRVHQSVMGQDWPGPIEHVIVADQGSPVPMLFPSGDLDPIRSVRVYTLNDTWRDGVRDKSVGAVPWMVGSLLARGDILGFCGDDDELHPDHVRRHVATLTTPGVDFTISPVRFVVGGTERFVIGDASFAHGHLDSDGIMCHASTLKTATWNANGDDAADFRLVADWRDRGMRGEYIGGEPTATHHDGWAAR